MASAGITALLKKMDYKDVVIAIDGSLFRFSRFIIDVFNCTWPGLNAISQNGNASKYIKQNGTENKLK
jgi:hypothetical protein